MRTVVPADNAPMTSVPRGEGVAAWRQIADSLAAAIAAGRPQPGARLPTEAVLAAQFGVNRHTVRRALAALAGRGLVRTTQGSGTFVEHGPMLYPIGPRTRFSEIVAAGGREPGGTLLDAKELPASPAVADALAIGRSAPVLQLTALRSADGAPISFSLSHVPLPRFAGFAGLLTEGATVSEAFARCGVADYRRRDTRITARLATPEEAVRLELAPGRVVLVVDSVNVDPDGIPIQATAALFAADRVEILLQS